MGFLRQEYWSGLPFPSIGDLPDPRITPKSLALQADSLPAEPPGKPNQFLWNSLILYRIFQLILELGSGSSGPPWEPESGVRQAGLPSGPNTKGRSLASRQEQRELQTLLMQMFSICN